MLRVAKGFQEVMGKGKVREGEGSEERGTKIHTVGPGLFLKPELVAHLGAGWACNLEISGNSARSHLHSVPADAAMKDTQAEEGV